MRRVDSTLSDRWRLAWLRALAWYLRHAPDHPGRWRLALRAVAMAPLLRADARSRVVALRGGGRLSVNGLSQTGRILYVTGEYEPATTRIVERALGPGDTMIDVGANIGFFAVSAARRVGAAGRVLAFEPAGETRRELLANVELNGLTNVDVRADALGASTGTATLYAGPAEDTGLASLRPLDGSRTIEVHLTRFDDIPEGPARVRLVKIDVEGAELDVLRGMSACLDRDRPDVVVEVTDAFLRAMGASAQALWTFLAERGYRIHWIRDDGTLVPLREAADLDTCPGQFNAFCTAG